MSPAGVIAPLPSRTPGSWPPTSVAVSRICSRHPADRRIESRRHFSPARMLAPRDDRDGGAGRTAPLSCCCLMPLPGRRFAITFGASSPRALWSTRRSAARSGRVHQDCPPPWTIRAPSAQQVALGQPEARPVLQSWNAWHASCARVKVTRAPMVRETRTRRTADVPMPGSSVTTARNRCSAALPRTQRARQSHRFASRSICRTASNSVPRPEWI